VGKLDSEHESRLNSLLQWLMDTHMTLAAQEQPTWVSSAHIDIEGGVVRATLNRVDPSFSRELLRQAGALLAISEQPCVAVAVPPSVVALPRRSNPE
jgi:hypothetical protein